MDAAIEAIVEKVAPKKEAFVALCEILAPGALLLTNTSSISITDLASATNRPEQVCGTHFFTPPPVREAVELPRGLLTTDETVEKAKALITSFGKLPVVVNKDVSGFVANRFLIPKIIEVSRLLEEGGSKQGGHRPAGEEGDRCPILKYKIFRTDLLSPTS